MNSKNIISYYRDCYKEDSADLNLWNLNKLKKEDCLVLDGQDDLGSGFLPRLPLPIEFAEQMMKRVQVYQRERVLLYVSFILVGKMEVKGEMKQLVTPILFNEATIEKDDNSYYFTVVNPIPEVNEPLTQLLMPEGSMTPNLKDSAHIQSASLWTSWLKNSPLELNLLELLNFPNLVNSDEIKKALKRKTPTLLPASMLVFVERSTSSRGIIHELEEIIASNELSSPLSDLLMPLAQPLNISHASKPLKYDYLPGLLSTPQKKIISIAANASLGCVSGPPGTGKSYTIAAIAAEHMARGESVLIVTNNDAALDVIANKLDDNFGLSDISIRAGQKEFLKKLKTYIADLLAGYFSDDLKTDPKLCESDLSKLNNSLNKLEKRFVKFCHKAIIRGQRLKKLEQTDSQWMKRIYLALAQNGILQLAKQWASLNEINIKHIEREALASHYLSTLKNKNLKTLVETKRKSLQAFNKAIRSRTSKKQFELFDDIEYSALLSAFPVWLVSLNTLYRVLPLKAQMFDLVIIDEATQCNISSCLPALYRAKRAMVVGDTKQLKHYSFLAKNKEAQLTTKNNLTENTDGVVSYRDNSILDLTLRALNSHQQLAFLDEHFRSKPELIHFSNECFYQNKLKIMQHRPCTSSGHLHVQRLNGVRDKSGVNHLEASKVIESITKQINEDNQAGITHTIGVISPFRHQAEHINKEVEANFSDTEIIKHKIRVATPYGFQGEERDVMLISFSLDNDSKRAAVYLNKADVFNVTITRARQKQILFLSIDETQLPGHNLLRQYLSSISKFEATHTIASELDEFQQKVILELDKLNIETWPGYTIAGTEIDILCRYNGHYLAIDLIGFPGPWADFFELNTYKLFKRAGIEVLPISYGLWVVDKNVCIQKIISKLR
ncbi:DEAD/DEAH box helicase [Pseudoalteromonas denitrificans]|uniref:AAA domain-containing protein n=1 Tax=Pseudoalteromonas denitrificans DSM 6059 TaxID=1123010 RepID=A0A1I1J000_9GAMM|nr:DEAD/DEAH box helicase [Pseudoalteromonas denitrificans]SFC41816.1 AAA domain-containing protein [Pseudoalteromonas denitrificans DSM 6059]